MSENKIHPLLAKLDSISFVPDDPNKRAEPAEEIDSSLLAALDSISTDHLPRQRPERAPNRAVLSNTSSLSQDEINHIASQLGAKQK